MPAPEAQAPTPALRWAHSARFLTTASQVQQLPLPHLPEVAFVGRSNAGKSSAINALAQHRRLAFASRTPGRTQHINLFQVGPKETPGQLWADLPGYGYAAVSRDSKLRWQAVMADYLKERQGLRAVVLLVDSRLGLTPLDERLIDWIAPRLAGGKTALLVLLTKADKLSRKEADAAVRTAQAQLEQRCEEGSDVNLSLFSTLSGKGLADVADTLYGWREAASAASVQESTEAEGNGAKPSPAPV